MQTEAPLFGWFGRALRTSLQGTIWKSPPDCPPQSLAGGQVLRLMATGAAHVHGSSVSDSARPPCKQPIIHNVAADATVCTRPDTDQAYRFSGTLRGLALFIDPDQVAAGVTVLSAQAQIANDGKPGMS